LCEREPLHTSVRHVLIFDSLKISLVKSIKQILGSSLKFKLVALYVILYFLWSKSLLHFVDEA